jgi:E3 ubiquitin-protein ligase FANCL
MIFEEDEPPNSGGTGHVAFVECTSGLHSFRVGQHPQTGAVDLTTLVVDADLATVLHGVASAPWFVQRLKTCTTVAALAAAIQGTVNEVVAQHPSAAPWAASGATASSGDLPQLLMTQLDALGWDRVVRVNDDMSVIQMRSVDAAGRDHVFDVVVPADYPRRPPTVQATLPTKVEVPWAAANSNSNSSGTLAAVAAAVDREVKRYERLFHELHELDQHTWVLEPAQPTFAVTSRRLAIERSCSVVLELNVEHPRDPCTMQFYGPPARATHFRVAVGKNLHRWSKDRSVRENLEAMLEQPLPSKHASTEAGAGAALCEECGICYSYALAAGATAAATTEAAPTHVGGTVVPDQACPNPKCCKMYHATCLVDWLQSLPNSKSSFGTVFGTCPYCSEPISVRIQQGR